MNQQLTEIAERRSKKSQLRLCGSRNRSTKPRPAQEFDEMMALKRIYSSIWTATTLLNDCFGWSVLAIVTRSLIGMTSHVYWLFLELKSLISHFDLILDSAINVLLIAMQLSALCLSCYNCTSCVSANKQQKSIFSMNFQFF